MNTFDMILSFVSFVSVTADQPPAFTSHGPGLFVLSHHTSPALSTISVDPGSGQAGLGTSGKELGARGHLIKRH